MFNFFKKKPVGKPLDAPTEKTTLEAGELIKTNDDATFYKVTKPLNPFLEHGLHNSTLQIMFAEVYVQHDSSQIKKKECHEYEWFSQKVYFWNIKEKFEKKSLPADYKNFEPKYFILVGENQNISCSSEKVMPWFGFEGLGTRFYCEHNHQKLEVSELVNLGYFQQIKFVELNEINHEILKNREKCFYWIPDSSVTFKNNDFYLNNSKVTIDFIYSVGLLLIAERQSV